MKKIIIVNNNLETGGVQTSLVNLLNEIKDKYDLTLLLFHVKPDQLSRIPEDVKLITVKSPFKHFGTSLCDTRGKPAMFLARAFWVILAKLFGRAFVIKMMLPFEKKYGSYDYAVSFLHEGTPSIVYGGCNEFVLNRIDAERKIGWLHCDFRLCGADAEKSRRIYEKFDSIVACSDGCRAAFLKCYPEFESKTVSVRNCNDYGKIKALAGDGCNYDKEYFNVVTVARLSDEKGIDRSLLAVSECIKDGFKLKYHIVGAGPMESLLLNKAEELGISDSVIFHGNQKNPYPYMKSADLLLLTSYHEAAPMVFDEAACLGLPVLATETISTHEILEQTGYGMVCKNEQSNITNSLRGLLGSQETLGKIRERLANAEFNNRDAIEKIERLLR